MKLITCTNVFGAFRYILQTLSSFVNHEDLFDCSRL